MCEALSLDTDCGTMLQEPSDSPNVGDSMKVLAVLLLSMAATSHAYEQCSAKTEFCPEDGSFQGCRVVVDGTERFYGPGELSVFHCRNFCEYLTNGVLPWWP